MRIIVEIEPESGQVANVRQEPQRADYAAIQQELDTRRRKILQLEAELADVHAQLTDRAENAEQQVARVIALADQLENESGGTWQAIASRIFAALANDPEAFVVLNA